MNLVKKLAATTIVSALALTSAACGSGSSTELAGSSGGGVTKVKIYYTAPLTQFSLATIAAENHLYPKDVDVTVTGGNSTVGVSLASSGRTDFYLSTQPIPEQLAQGGAKLTWLATWQDGLNGLFIARDGVKSLADMKGKTLGIVQPGFTLSLAGDTALRGAGLGKGDYKSISLGTVPALASAFAAGTVDAVVLDRVTATKLLKTVKGSTMLYDFYSKDFPWVGSGVTVSGGFAAKHPAAVSSVLVGLNRALKLVHSDPATADAAITKVTSLPAGAALDGAVKDFQTHSTDQLEPVSDAQVHQAMATLHAAGSSWATDAFGKTVLADPAFLTKALAR